MTDKPAIAYVGVGLMGLPMTKRLLSLGYAVRAFDIAPVQRDAADAAAIAESPPAQPMVPCVSSEKRSDTAPASVGRMGGL